MRWPKPAEVLARWAGNAVPEVEVRQFPPNTEGLPWIERRSGTGFDLGPASRSTARILCGWYQTALQEERDAYRIFAYLLSRGRSEFGYELFGPFFEHRSRPARSFYSGTARHVLPAPDAPSRAFPVPSDPRQQARVWTDVVDAAGAAWSVVAADWAVGCVAPFPPGCAGPSVDPARRSPNTQQVA